MGVEDMVKLPEGHYEESDEGDVVVPVNDTPDELGWQKEKRFDHEIFLKDSSKEVFDPFVRAAKELVGEVVEVVEPDVEPATEKTFQERLNEVKERFQFMPYSREELSYITGLTGQDRVMGAATYLNVVLKHQFETLANWKLKNEDLPEGEKRDIDEDMPRKSLLSIISRFGEYARTSQAQRSQLLHLTDMIAARETKRSEPATATPVVRDWKNDGSTRAPILLLVKSEAVESYTKNGGDEKLPYALDDKKLTSNGKDVLGDSFVSSLKTGELQDKIAISAAENQRRYRFWVDALQQARAHNVTKASAEAILKKLGELKEEEE